MVITRRPTPIPGAAVLSSIWNLFHFKTSGPEVSISAQISCIHTLFLSLKTAATWVNFEPLDAAT